MRSDDLSDHACSAPVIPNHYSATLSALDLEIIRAVPPGGNWKNIPTTIPSKRLEQIRESFAAGNGSRSTYYGRLHPDRPSYTINTYFSRPGNGCHIHYEQDRVLSQREAARLQSFPDHFIFYGSKGAIEKQIGNALPPLLAFQIARQLRITGNFVDLFCGAGGLSLGFTWAGWTSVGANDIDPHSVSTYRENIDERVVLGDVRSSSTMKDLKSMIRAADRNMPLLVLGGPPCQGFSTAGNRRTMTDERNHLFKNYVDLLRDVSADGFVFENVVGLASMGKGAVLRMILDHFSKCGYSVQLWTIRADEHAIPQRRTRLIIFGAKSSLGPVSRPRAITERCLMTLFSASPSTINVRDALNDLPELSPGQDGSCLPYRFEATTLFQKFARKQLAASEYLDQVRGNS